MPSRWIQKIISNKKYLAIGSVVILGGGLFLYRSTAANSLPLRYITATVSKSTIVSSLVGSGQVATLNKVDIKPLASGVIREVRVKAGQMVKAGQVLVVLDQRNASAAYTQAKANYDKVVGGLSKSDYNLYQGNIKSAQLALEKARVDEVNSIAAAEGDLQNAHNNLKMAQGGEDSQIVAQAYQGSVLFLQSTLNKLQDTLNSMDNILGIDNSFSNDNFEDYLSRLDSSAMVQAQSDYISAAQEIKKFEKSVSVLNINSSHMDIDASFPLAESALQKMGKLSTDMSVMLSATLPLGTISQNSLDSMKSSVSSARSSMSSQYSSFLAQQKTMTDAKNSYESYKLAYDKAVRNLASVKTDAANNINNKEQALQQAQDAFQDKQNPLPEDVAQVKSQLMDAQTNLSNTIVTAPFDGQIAVLNAQKGDQSGSAVLATLITEQKIAQVTLNEVDVAKVKIGQKATLTFDAVPDLTVAGQVAQVDTIGTVTQGVVNYNVQINFDNNTDQVKPGMSVSAAIITNVASDVLSVPIAAVKSAATQSYVEIVNADELVPLAENPNQFILKNSPVRQVVETGVSNDTSIEIISGLAEGQTVIAQTIDPNKTTASTAASSGGVRIPGLTGSTGGGGNFTAGTRALGR